MTYERFKRVIEKVDNFISKNMTDLSTSELATHVRLLFKSEEIHLNNRQALEYVIKRWKREFRRF